MLKNYGQMILRTFCWGHLPTLVLVLVQGLNDLVRPQCTLRVLLI